MMRNIFLCGLRDHTTKLDSSNDVERKLLRSAEDLLKKLKDLVFEELCDTISVNRKRKTNGYKRKYVLLLNSSFLAGFMSPGKANDLHLC